MLFLREEADWPRKQCRDQSVPYECKKCGFIGP